MTALGNTNSLEEQMDWIGSDWISEFLDRRLDIWYMMVSYLRQYLPVFKLK